MCAKLRERVLRKMIDLTDYRLGPGSDPENRYPPTPPIGGLLIHNCPSPQPFLPIRINCEETLIIPNTTITRIDPFSLAVYGLPAGYPAP
jgi:hypothetical protein